MQILAHKPPFDATGILTLTGVCSRSEDLSDEDLARIATALFFRIFRFNPLENYMRLERKALLDRIVNAGLVPREIGRYVPQVIELVVHP